jgi:hypothetical protein
MSIGKVAPSAAMAETAVRLNLKPHKYASDLGAGEALVLDISIRKRLTAQIWMSMLNLACT